MLFKYNNEEYELIFLSIAGSRLYGTEYEKGDNPIDPEYISDYDYRGIFINKTENKVGLIGTIEHISPKTPETQKPVIDELNRVLGLHMDTDDIALYEIEKYMKMASENNPNIMDLLFAPDDSILYINDKGKMLRENSHIFLSTKVRHTFSGYAMSQLNRIKSHNKWLTQYPDINGLIDALKEAYQDGNIDYEFINEKFDGKLSNFVTEKEQTDISNLRRKGEKPHQKIDIFQFYEEYCLGEDYGTPKISFDSLKSMMRPQLIDYCTVKDLRGHPFKMDEEAFDINGISTGMSYEKLLNESGAFRTISETQFNIFLAPDEKYRGGVFAPNGDLKNNDPKEVSNFVCQMSVNKNQYKADCDKIEKLWNWRVNRNDKRSVLEEKYGFDSKHAAHLVRLMEGCQDFLSTGVYTPKLEDERKQFVRDIRDGKYEYDWVVDYAEKKDAELDEIYKESPLPKKPDMKSINELLITLQMSPPAVDKSKENIHSLRQRFVKDFKLPITIMRSPYFEEQLKVYDKMYNSIALYNMYMDDVNSFDNQDAYFKEYNRVKDKVINYLKEKESYKEFNSCDMKKYSKRTDVSNQELYIIPNVGKSFISIDLKKANFASLKHHNSDIVDNTDNYEEFIAQFTDMKSITDSKYIRQVIFGNLNPKRQQSVQKSIIADMIEHLKGIYPHTSFRTASSDEIIIELPENYNSDMHQETINLMQEHFPEIVLHFDTFTIKSIGNKKYFAKEFFEVDIDGNKKYFDKSKSDIKGVPGHIFIQVFKEYMGIKKDSKDNLFYHEKRLCQFIDSEYPKTKFGKNLELPEIKKNIEKDIIEKIVKKIELKDSGKNLDIEQRRIF